MPDLDVLAELGYDAFCNSPAHVYLPPRPAAWADLPEVLKEAWKAATKKIIESL
jgi:hypothetical protein